ncbi:hypothetical protein BS614_19980 [Paenibacillus xylanexedens]|nr:hypothetical protein [Paenibacillus xylanexedens]APO48327.1 hypothetical protein BS614_19980 [Paenibacillus xylanexedens]
MMRSKKIMLMLTGVLAFGVLSACGTSKESAHTDGHGGMNHTEMNSETEGASHDHAGPHADSTASSPKASFSFASDVKANENSHLTIQITDADGNPVNEFEMGHEKRMHLIVVSKDLSYFNHIHPDYKGDGKFAIETSFPAGGEYKILADFVPKGGASTTLSEWVNVGGQEKAQKPVQADSNLVKEVDGKKIELSLSTKKANNDVNLTFNIMDASTNEGINNLEQYLGAVGHVVILSEDAEQYLHVHPTEEKATGPKAEFMTSFPHSGIYKIWGQFQHDGEVFTVPFVVDVM